MGRSGLRRLAKGTGLVAVVGVVAVLIAAYVAPQLIARGPAACRATTIVQLRLLMSELETYQIENAGRLPTTQQGLEALVKEPSSPPKPKRWKGPYIEYVPKDGWGNEYRYASLDGGRAFRVWSLGADGVEGGTGFDADIRSWEQATWTEG